jgi:hypothetical protein
MEASVLTVDMETGWGEIVTSEYRLIESPAPGIISRCSVYESLKQEEIRNWN